MQRIEKQDTDSQELAKNVLSWIICAKRPLTPSKLQHALAVEPGDHELDVDNLPLIEDMVSVCAGLVTVDEESGIIRLVHYTTQEYFQQTQGHWFPDAETNITRVCTAYLSFRPFESGRCQSIHELEERLQLNKLYHYSANNWGYHARKALTLCPEVISFLNCDVYVEASIQVLDRSPYRSSSPRKTRMTGLHLAASFGVEGAIKALLSKGVKVNVTDTGDQKAPEAKLDLKDKLGRTPLSWAARNGHKAVVEQLLEKGANLDLKDRFGGTPLSRAAENGHEVVVNQLLEKGADLESKDKRRQTPLSLAAENGHEAVVKQLLHKGADIDTKDMSGQTPLSWTAMHGHEAVVKQLLKKGADPESKDNIYGHTPLSYAAKYGHERVVKLLLNKGGKLQ
jgi:ankyrin repeat protein